MIICLCANVSDKRIKQAILEGATFEDLQIDLGACIQCGCCKPLIDEMLEQAELNKHS